MKNWIAKMQMHKGALHKELHVPEGEKIPKEKLEKAAHHKGIEGKRARLAETLEGLHHDKKEHSKKMSKAGAKGDKKLAKEVKAGKKELKVKKVMHEFKEGKLHSGSKKGPQVSNPKQAIAIALSEAKRASKSNKK